MSSFSPPLDASSGWETGPKVRYSWLIVHLLQASCLSLVKAFQCLTDSAVIWGWCCNTSESYSNNETAGFLTTPGTQQVLGKCSWPTRFLPPSPPSPKSPGSSKLTALCHLAVSSSLFLWPSLYQAVFIFLFSTPPVAPSQIPSIPYKFITCRDFFSASFSCSPWQPRHIKGFNCWQTMTAHWISIWESLPKLQAWGANHPWTSSLDPALQPTLKTQRLSNSAY